MRRVLAIDKQSGFVTGRQDARDKTEGTRHSHIYRCLNTSCSCTFHWRQAVRAKENTEVRPATFVKNPSSDHIAGCRYDYSAFAHEHRDVAFSDGDNLHLRIQFPLGAARSDLRPWEPGALSDRQRLAAHHNIDKRGFSSLEALLDFIEKKLGGLEDPALDDVILHYQGLELKWNDLFVRSDHYSKLIHKGREKDKDDKTSPTFAIVKPSHMGDRTAKGNRRFICESQEARPDKRLMAVHPILVCRDDFTVSCLDEIVERDGSIMVASRPHIIDPQRGNDLFAYLYFTERTQYTMVAKQYWHPITAARHQMDLFGGMHAH